jgi:hypothetical protein
MNHLITAAAVGLIGLSAGASVPLASAAPSEQSTTTETRLAESGLAKRVVVTGLCRARGHYRLVLTNDGAGEHPSVVAELTVRGVPKRSLWGYTSEATTRFDDGTAVTGIGDFGSARADRRGVIEVDAATPAGIRHTFGLVLSNEHNRCVVSASA